MEAVLCILGFPSIPDLYRADHSASLLHPLLTSCDDKTFSRHCPVSLGGQKTSSSAPRARSRFYVHWIFIENTWQERLWAMRWGYDSEESKCPSVFMELRSGGEGQSPGCGETLERVLCSGPGRSQGSSGSITLRTCKPWKDPVTSQYIVLFWPVGPSDKWGKWALPLGDSFCSTGS